ncbi:hypothetical protein ES707_10078 [subsurface metagenome]
MSKESDKVRRKLDILTDWSPEALEEELSGWTPEEVADMWNLLEIPYRQICRAFGMATQRQRVSIRGIHTHQQIRRLMVLQRHAGEGT